MRSRWALDALAQGPHRITFHALDRVGNAEAVQDFAFVVAREAPEIAVSVQGPQHSDHGVRYVSPVSEIALSARDTAAGPASLRYRFAGADGDTAYQAPFRLPAQSGIHRLRIEAEDPVHNLAQLALNDLYVDATPPTTEVEFSSPFYRRDGEVVLNSRSLVRLDSSDLESGVQTVSYTLDGGPAQNYSEPFSIAGEGEHRLTVSAQDWLGNREPAQQFSVRVKDAANRPAPPPSLDPRRWYLHPQLGLVGPPGLAFELQIAASPEPGADSFQLAATHRRPSRRDNWC